MNQSEEMNGATRAAQLPAFFYLVELESCGSTNDEAKELARQGAPEGTMVFAHRQTGGRGRRGRAWNSPEGNLACSLVLRPALPPADAALLSFVAALAVAETVAALTPARPTLKWPNDVLVGGAKISGILLESEPSPTGLVDWLVLGTGINVSTFPDDTPYPATCLRAVGAVADITPRLVLAHYSRHFEHWYQRLLRQGFAPIRAAWLNAAQGLGAPVTVRLAHENFSGILRDLDMDGALLVDCDGFIRRVTAGDVFFGREG
ncbi:biotin--[acetyl-CoA-carboxylase] ligase [Niveispirillum sp. BGYR6]|uniref:biotin--[acetyl-CoA-carboxylase] ligase n=1 Tax=Niveispirillum sp. BGYR6 TaxID=2971249 RepID=UPI0022B9C7D7|nr:biotin--[acetyl-CoA-carboxylase] ligase [Niveispirillum sp. BGYR6]MDG5494494.1 biotin--[acetyl-CoA-carboxylase] ligase [Niveispirillum sp. BGYR6]